MAASREPLSCVPTMPQLIDGPDLTSTLLTATVSRLPTGAPKLRVGVGADISAVGRCPGFGVGDGVGGGGVGVGVGVGGGGVGVGDGLGPGVGVGVGGGGVGVGVGGGGVGVGVGGGGVGVGVGGGVGVGDGDAKTTKCSTVSQPLTPASKVT